MSEDLTITSVTSVIAPIDILTIHTMDSCTITDTENFLLSAFGDLGTESRIYVDAHDVEVTILSDVNTIEWEVDVDFGYLPHVDIRLDNGETLVFEYAKVDTPCDNSPYPTGEQETFGDKGIVDSDAMAWLSSGPAGPCGDETFDTNHKSLADWKSQWGDVEVIAFEFEIDNWIEDSDSVINHILINDNTIEVSLKPSDELNFNVESTYGLLCVGDDTITTTVTERV